MTTTRTRLLAVPVLSLAVLVCTAVGGCSTADTPTPGLASPVAAATSTGPSGPSGSASSSRPAHLRLAPSDVVGPYARSVLTDAAVVRRGTDYEVISAWTSTRAGHRREAAILVTDGSGSHAERWTRGRARRLLATSPDRYPGAEAAMAPLLAASATSLVLGLRAAVGGGDGATLLPFEQVARDTGSGWTTYDVTTVQPSGSPAGEMPYVSSQAVLPDGRLVVLLDHWSGDRYSHGNGNHWSAAHHGLWISDGSDWSTFRPWTPRLAPGSGFDVEPGSGSAYSLLGASTAGDGVVWFVAQGMLFASPDGQVFRQVEWS